MAQFTNQAQLSYNSTVVNSNVAVGELLDVLSATKTAVGNSYSRGDSIVYVISIVNSGTAPFNDLTITDDLGAYAFDTQTLYPLTYETGTVRYYVNGALQSAPTVGANQPLTISGISVPAGGNATVIYRANVSAYAPTGTGGTIENTAAISGGGLSTDLTADETVTAVAAPDLTVTKSVSPVPVSENGTLTYTFVIQNYGSVEAGAGDNVVLSDTFDPILTNLSVTLDGSPLAETTNYEYNTGTGVFNTVTGTITVPAAQFAQDGTTGVWTVTPGVTTLVVTGTV